MRSREEGQKRNKIKNIQKIKSREHSRKGEVIISR